MNNKVVSFIWSRMISKSWTLLAILFTPYWIEGLALRVGTPTSYHIANQLNASVWCDAYFEGVTVYQWPAHELVWQNNVQYYGVFLHGQGMLTPLIRCNKSLITQVSDVARRLGVAHCPWQKVHNPKSKRSGLFSAKHDVLYNVHSISNVCCNTE